VIDFSAADFATINAGLTLAEAMACSGSSPSIRSSRLSRCASPTPTTATRTGSWSDSSPTTWSTPNLRAETTQSFEAIMPRYLPASRHRDLIYVSGVAELACAFGLVKQTAWASAGSKAVLLAVFPANVQMALDAGSGRLPGASDNPVVAWGRLPLQGLMIWAASQARPADRAA
jgi:uncharacterized membrane protein